MAIPALLLEARRLQSTTPPRWTWAQLCAVVDRCDLEILDRHPEIEALYVGEFRQLVLQNHGSTENYLNQRLEWKAPAQRDGSYFQAEGDPELIRVLENDWPYAVPPNVDHFVVWSQRAILHPDTAIYPTPAPSPPLPHTAPSIATSNTTKRSTWDEIATKGVSGFVGGSGKYSGFGGDSEAGQEISKFVAPRWRVSDGWETAWFCNPPHLQSVPGLAHFHVFALRSAV